MLSFKTSEYTTADAYMSVAKIIGQTAEQKACAFLQSHGLRLIAQNYRCLNGEIDLIMEDNETIVFVEVRARNHQHFATPFESVDSPKQTKLIKTSSHFLQKKNWFDKVNCRFDVIGISQNHIEWIKDAFSLET